MCLN
jgi:hypothetical protein